MLVTLNVTQQKVSENATLLCFTCVDLISHVSFHALGKQAEGTPGR